MGASQAWHIKEGIHRHVCGAIQVTVPAENPELLSFRCNILSSHKRAKVTGKNLYVSQRHFLSALDAF